VLARGAARRGFQPYRARPQRAGPAGHVAGSTVVDRWPGLLAGLGLARLGEASSPIERVPSERRRPDTSRALRVAGPVDGTGRGAARRGFQAYERVPNERRRLGASRALPISGLSAPTPVANPEPRPKQRARDSSRTPSAHGDETGDLLLRKSPVSSLGPRAEAKTTGSRPLEHALALRGSHLAVPLRSTQDGYLTGRPRPRTPSRGQNNGLETPRAPSSGAI
jgi:hypothetical protein